MRQERSMSPYTYARACSKPSTRRKSGHAMSRSETGSLAEPASGTWYSKIPLGKIAGGIGWLSRIGGERLPTPTSDAPAKVAPKAHGAAAPVKVQAPNSGSRAPRHIAVDASGLSASGTAPRGRKAGAAGSPTPPQDNQLKAFRGQPRQPGAPDSLRRRQLAAQPASYQDARLPSASSRLSKGGRSLFSSDDDSASCSPIHSGEQPVGRHLSHGSRQLVPMPQQTARSRHQPRHSSQRSSESRGSAEAPTAGQLAPTRSSGAYRTGSETASKVPAFTQASPKPAPQRTNSAAGSAQKPVTTSTRPPLVPRLDLGHVQANTQPPVAARRPPTTSSNAGWTPSLRRLGCVRHQAFKTVEMAALQGCAEVALEDSAASATLRSFLGDAIGLARLENLGAGARAQFTQVRPFSHPSACLHKARCIC